MNPNRGLPTVILTVLAMIAITFTGGSQSASAGIIHALTDANAIAGVKSASGQDSGQLYSFTNVFANDIDNNAYAQAIGRAGGSSLSDIVQVSASAQKGTSTADATWRDYVTLTGEVGSIFPQTVRMYFEATIVFSISDLLTSDGAFLRWATSADGGGPGAFSGFLGLETSNGISHLSGSDNWDKITAYTPSVDIRAFTVNFHADITLGSDGPGRVSGYWTLTQQADVRNVFQTRLASINGVDPPHLGPYSVLMPDGSTPESKGFSVTFDSGLPLTINSVPEPASMTSLLCAVIPITAYRWIKRSQRNRVVKLPSIVA